VYPGSRLEIFANTLFTDAAASIYGLNYDPSTLAGPTPGLDWELMSQSFGSYSGLRTRYVSQVLGVNIKVADNVVLNTNAEYHDYRDGQPYLFDTTGRRVTSFVGLTWLW
jgi:hypothetical protein